MYEVLKTTIELLSKRINEPESPLTVAVRRPPFFG